MSDKKRKSEYLLSEIGGIDESFLAEAESYRKKRSPMWLKPLVAVACACLFVAGVLTTVLNKGGVFDNNVGMEAAPESNDMIEGDKNEANVDKATEATPDFEPEEVRKIGFDALLSLQTEYIDGDSLTDEGTREQGKTYVVGYDSFEAVRREYGETYILWRHVDGGKLFMSRALDNDEVEAINKRLGIGRAVGADSPMLEFNVWILRGDGSVISPYLIGSGGNIGSTLFDYEAEIIPQEELIEIIGEILADKPQN